MHLWAFDVLLFYNLYSALSIPLVNFVTQYSILLAKILSIRYDIYTVFYSVFYGLVL